MKSKRDDLIDATKALLWDVGYEAMSPKRILSNSGAGQGSLYHHFSGKKELAAIALADVEEEMRRDCDRIFAAKKPPMERLSDYLKLERNGLKGCRLGRLANESAIGDEALRKPLAKYFSHVEKTVEDTIAKAVAAGELNGHVRPKEVAAMLVATVQGGYVLSRIHNDPNRLRLATKGAAAILEILKTK